MNRTALLFVLLIGMALTQPAFASPRCTDLTTVASGFTPVTSTALEATHVISTSKAGLCGVYAANSTATPGWLVVYNATTAPGDGALTGALVLDAIPLPANGVASINYYGGPPKAYSIGITVILTSAVTPFTKTTGVITGFINGSLPQ